MLVTIRTRRFRGIATLVALLAPAAAASAQQFIQETTTRFPSQAEYSNQLTIGDVNNDGHLDILFANFNNFGCSSGNQQLRLYINDGTGVFADESTDRMGTLLLKARGVELGDIENDGDLDIIVAQDCNQAAVLLVNDNADLGNFTNESATRLPTTTMASSRGQFGDIDNDGDLDLFFCNGGSTRFGTGQNKVFENDGSGFYTDITSTAMAGIANVGEPMDAIMGDIDFDFDLDALVGSRDLNGSRLYKNNGDGTFSQVTFPGDGATYSYDFGDFNGSGSLDLLGANSGPSSSELLLRNSGAGVFSAVSFPAVSFDDNDSKFIDWDNDGDLDAIVARIFGPERTYLNTGGVYTLVTGILPSVTSSALDVMVADLDGDGAYDVVTAQGESGNFQNRIFMNTGPADTQPPTITATEQLEDTEDAVGPYVVRANILDDMSSDRNFFDKGIFLNYTTSTPGPINSVEMFQMGNNLYRGEIPGQPNGTTIEYWVTALDWNENLGTGDTLSFDVASIVPPCLDFEECADDDDNGLRDDACLWYECDAGVCIGSSRFSQGDLGGEFGACPIDGTCDGNDRFHALNCFSNTDTMGNPASYPCELAAPAALNVDAGQVESCALDGVCDSNDAFHALNCFENRWFDGSIGYLCGCSGPAPVAPLIDPVSRQSAGLELRALQFVRGGDIVSVDVHIVGNLEALRGYQLHLGSGLELVDVFVDSDRKDWVFADVAGVWSAFNQSTAQVAVGMDAAQGSSAASGSYLATFAYRVPKRATGQAVIDVLVGDGSTKSNGRTFLFGHSAQRIHITATPPAVIGLGQGRSGRAGR